MAAIITDSFRRNNARNFLAEIVSSSSDYYVGIGKPDQWDANESLSSYVVPSPTGSVTERREVLSNLITLVKVTADASKLIIPNIPYRGSYAYKPYDQNDPSCFWPSTSGSVTTYPCYAINNGNIYQCLRRGTGVSTNAPTGTSRNPTSGVDGYVWIFLATISPSSPFASDQFVSVEEEAITAATTATGGLVYGFNVLNGGSGYVPGVTAKLIGAGADVDLVVTVSVGGQISSVDFVSGTISTLTFPKGYASATVVLGNTGSGTGAFVAPKLGPAQGFGYNSVETLPTWFLGVSADFSSDVNGDGFYIPYRQVSLIRDPSTNADDSTFESLDALRYFKVNPDISVPFSVGDIITGTPAVGTVAPKAFFDGFAKVEVTTGVFEGRIYFHQNNSPKVNTKAFYSAGSSSVSISNGSSSTTFAYTTILTNTEYARNSGEVIFIENRKAITRSSLQTEQIKLVIQF